MTGPRNWSAILWERLSADETWRRSLNSTWPSSKTWGRRGVPTASAHATIAPVTGARYQVETLPEIQRWFVASEGEIPDQPIEEGRGVNAAHPAPIQTQHSKGLLILLRIMGGAHAPVSIHVLFFLPSRRPKRWPPRFWSVFETTCRASQNSSLAQKGRTLRFSLSPLVGGETFFRCGTLPIT